MKRNAKVQRKGICKKVKKHSPRQYGTADAKAVIAQFQDLSHDVGTNPEELIAAAEYQ